MLNPLLREVHRLRKLARDCQQEIERAPKLHKAHQTKIAAAEKGVLDAKEELKKRKAGILTVEAQIKSLNQSLAKHEKQLDGLTSPRDIEAKEHDIANTKAGIAKQEDELMRLMTEVDERTAAIPGVEAGLAKVKADFAMFEKESAERLTRLKDELAVTTKALAAEETKIPPSVRVQYERIVKAYGADALAAVENLSCQQCRVAITVQKLSDIRHADEMICCRSCGRGLYVVS